MKLSKILIIESMLIEAYKLILLKYKQFSYKVSPSML